MILIGNSREELQQWQQAIADFLQTKLHLQLKHKVVVQPFKNGIDFLGYRIYPHHLTVRPRLLLLRKIAAMAVFICAADCRRTLAYYRRGEFLSLRQTGYTRDGRRVRMIDRWSVKGEKNGR